MVASMSQLPSTSAKLSSCLYATLHGCCVYMQEPAPVSSSLPTQKEDRTTPPLPPSPKGEGTTSSLLPHPKGQRATAPLPVGSPKQAWTIRAKPGVESLPLPTRAAIAAPTIMVTVASSGHPVFPHHSTGTTWRCLVMLAFPVLLLWSTTP